MIPFPSMGTLKRIVMMHFLARDYASGHSFLSCKADKASKNSRKEARVGRKTFSSMQISCTAAPCTSLLTVLLLGVIVYPTMPLGVPCDAPRAS